MDNGSKYIQVIVPLKLRWNPWYTADFEVRRGMMVSVTLSGRKYFAVVINISETPPEGIRNILPARAADGLGDITENELAFWEFISTYYLCTIGEVFKYAYPSVKIRSELTVSRIRQRMEDSRDKARQAAEAKIARLKLSLKATADSLSLRHSDNVRQRLLDKKAGILSKIRAAETELAACMPRRPHPERTLSFRPETSAPETVIGPDRTAFYISGIEYALSNNSSVLVLEPEYDPVSSMELELRERFGGILLTYNPGQTQTQNRLVCSTIREEGTPHIILGTRSAVFLPFRELGLVIVNEEQDLSYKQRDRAPRFNARDAASILSTIFGAKLMMGTNAPSLETYYNCLCGKYTMRHTDVCRRSEVEIVEIPAERRKNGMSGLFSRKALKKILETEGNIVIVRGWEKEDDISQQLSSIIPGREFCIMSYSSARKSDSKSELTIVLQADFTFSRTDFRSDEKAFQVLSALKDKTRKLVIQTSNASHPVLRCIESGDWEMLYNSLLEERKEYNLPPYTRISDIITEDGTLIKRVPMERGDKSLAEKKKRLFEQYGKTFILDVDPL